MSRHAPLLVLLAVPALLPFGRASELPLLIGAVLGLVWLWQGRIAIGAPAVRLAGLLFLGYWLPQLLSAFDAVAPRKAWIEVAADLRYLPFLLFAIGTLDSAERVRRAVLGSAAIVAVWLLDALVQALTGWSLGGPAEADRLSGIFGADDLKLGNAVAVLSPLLLWPAWQARRWLAALALVAVLVVVLLAGARAGWISLAVAIVLLLWAALPHRQALLAFAAVTLLALLGAAASYQLSERFAARIDRSAAALAGDPAAIDHALSFRLPIWRAAGSMIVTHPVNGVGVRGFRYAYAEHAAADDRFIGFDGDRGAFHAHQWLLEVASETGLVGLSCWLLAIAAAVRGWRAADAAARRAAWPATVALVAMLFPLNTHYAVYSSVWGGLLFVLLALWIPAVAASYRAGPPTSDC